MDERALSLVFLLMAGILPLRALAGQWAGRPDRRAHVRMLWGGYLLVAVVAVAALIWMVRDGGGPGPARPEDPEQFALREPAWSGISAR